MKTGVLLAALALLIPAVGVAAQGKAGHKVGHKADAKAEAKAKEALKNPAALKEKAPEKFQVKFETTQGAFVLDVTRAWSPKGADRFYNLVKHGFFDGMKFFRVVPNFVVQFGIHGDPALATKWLEANIEDDKVVQSNKRGFITYAKSGAPNSRSTQLFINLQDNDRLDAMGFSPFGKVSKGMDVVDKLYGGYGEQLTQLQGQIAQEGNKYLEKSWPKLDSIKKATLVK
jgi:peptidyl-prolyl cis-trans isomerase A (cyclophilin A)